MVMIKRYFILMIILFLNCKNGKAFSILQDSPIYDTKGYDNCDMNKNGELQVIRKFLSNSDIVFDVGANIGDWSLQALNQSVEQIVAIEPVPDIFEELRTRITDSKVIKLNLALSDTIGTSRFVYYKSFSPVSGFYNRDILENKMKFEPTSINVQMATLDWCKTMLGINHINFLKIDTEGAEFLVLKGAVNTLKNHEIDFIQFEYGGCYPDAGITLKQVYSLLNQYGYHIYRIFENGLIHITEWRNALETSLYSNYLAVSPKVQLGKYNLE